MTKKEHLIDEISKTRKEIELLGVLYTASYISPNKLKRYKVADLEERLNFFKKQLEIIKADVENKKFENSEYGVAIKTKAETLTNSRVDKVNELKKNLSKEVNALVKPALGKRWKLEVYQRTVIFRQFDKFGEEIFGHKFDATYNDYFEHANDPFMEFNYPTIGGFNSLTDSNRVDLIVKMAEIINNKELVKEMTAIFKKYNIEINNLGNEISEIARLSKDLKSNAKKIENYKSL